ncbi:MAG: IclR family transcriptional regulator [Candidatus Nanopelagicales bacterium]
MAETAQTLDRGLSVLSLLADSADGLTVTALARELGVSRAVVYRLTSTLVDRGFVRRSDDGRYSLGPQVARLGRRLDSALREVATAHLRVLADSLACSAWLATWGTDDVATVVAVAEPAQAQVAIQIRLGTRLPVDGSAVGAAIQAAQHGDVGVAERRERVVVGILEPDGTLVAHALALRLSPSVQAVIGVVPTRRLADGAPAKQLLTAATNIRLALQEH